ncbi:UNVERIFIED_CONTAM: hypothetical protein GTU68_019200 [Idotea baltica]|nr:hypothetical protein [Idotea baltica]
MRLPTFTYEVWVIAFDEIPSSQILPYIMQLQEEAKIDILTKTTEKCSLRVFPGYEAEVMEYFSGLGLEVKIQEINLEEHINETRKKRQSSQCTSSICDILPADEYLTYGQIEAYLSSISENNPDRVTKTSIGTTFEGQNIWMITIKNGSAPTERSMFIEGGIHAREWISPAVTLYFIDMLIKEPEIANGIEFRFVAVANPDG